MMLNRWKAILAATAITAVSAVALPAMAQANALWVGKSPKAPFNSCTSPGYATIQAAVSAPGTTIDVCPGTYTEQIQIERSVSIKAPMGGVTIKLPEPVKNSTTPCDTAITADTSPTKTPSRFAHQAQSVLPASPSKHCGQKGPATTACTVSS